jgi:O-antigen ligase
MLMFRSKAKGGTMRLEGYGNGNYMYALDTVTGQDSTKPFTSMAPNTLARLLVEKGIAGTSLYALLFLAVARALWQRRKQRESRIIGCTLLALLAKDMSQSAWEEVPFLMLMVYLLLAYLQREEEEEP